MSEIEPHDSVYGGEMTPYEWYQAEMEVDPEMPKWEIKKRIPLFKLQTAIGKLALTYANTQIWEFDEPYDKMNHLYVHDEEQYEKPLYVYYPDEDYVGEDVAEAFSDFIGKLVIAGFRLHAYGLPTKHDFDMYYLHARGEEEMETILDKIRNGEPDGTN